MSNRALYSIYTMKHSTKLREEAANDARGRLVEKKSWSTGSRLWTEANKEGQRLPLIFSAAEADSGLISWAYVEDITVTDDGTACVYSELRPIDPPRPLSSLRLKSTGRPLSDSYIRPYAICETPDFLD